MKNAVKFGVALFLATSAAHAGGIERTAQSVGIIFEKGNLLELSFSHASLSVSGVGAGTTPSLSTPTPGVSSGDITQNYFQIAFAYKHQFNKKLSFALIYDQPFGADVIYSTGTGYFAQDTNAKLNSSALSGVLKYTLDNNISVLGGIRYQSLKAKVSIPFVNNYSAFSKKDRSIGYLVGVAYERPKIAMRVALTYNSKISHDWRISETIGTAPPSISTVTVNTPQSVNLEFQTGVAKDTLLFGSVRWVDWSSFEITPDTYKAVTGESLVSYDDDTITYELGVGRRLNDNWSAALSLGYEPQVGGFATNLGPTDGNKSVTLGATYKQGKVEVTGGISYIWIGNARTQLGSTSQVTAANFTDNHAVGAGLRLCFRF